MNFKRVVLILAVATAMTGCSSAVVVGDKVVGLKDGKLYYTDGFLKTDCPYPFEDVWNASRTVFSEMKTLDTHEKRKIATGSLDGVVSNEKIHLDVEYISQKTTLVSIRSGVAGDQLASKLILDRIRIKLDNLPKSEQPPADGRSRN